MKYAFHNGKEIAKTNSNFLSIPKVYKAVTGKTLNIKEWQANLGKLDGLDWSEWCEQNNVEIKNYDSIRGIK